MIRKKVSSEPVMMLDVACLRLVTIVSLIFGTIVMTIWSCIDRQTVSTRICLSSTCQDRCVFRYVAVLIVDSIAEARLTISTIFVSFLFFFSFFISIMESSSWISGLLSRCRAVKDVLKQNITCAECVATQTSMRRVLPLQPL